MPNYEVLAEGLRFPEGPIAMPDGSVIVVEIARGTLSRVRGGQVEVAADLGGGPNGAAIGPDGRCYVCNNGGFAWVERRGRLFPSEQATDYSGGRIEAVELATGQAEVLYTHCDGEPLKGGRNDHGRTDVRPAPVHQL
ncbi:MAG: SMP-30/gluconolactonase/LRE family protein, partial [Gammaproteobacteria bacterium]|nr:SMP-30/gluconolactonase/LRE family protein [Gammaproteobacteria bacterium]